MYKFINNLAPAYLCNSFAPRTPNYYFRNAKKKLMLPKPLNDYLKRSFIYSGAFLWNNLPEEIRTSNRPFPSSPEPPFQNESRCQAFDMEIIFHSNANNNSFHKKGCTPNLILKVRVFGTRPIPQVSLREVPVDGFIILSTPTRQKCKIVFENF